MDDVEESTDHHASQSEQGHLIGAQEQHQELLDGAAVLEGTDAGIRHEHDGLAHQGEIDLDLDVDAMTQAIMAQAAAGFAEMQGLDHFDGGHAEGELDATMAVHDEGVVATEEGTTHDVSAPMEVEAGSATELAATDAAPAPSTFVAAAPPTEAGVTPPSPRGIKRPRESDTPVVTSITPSKQSQADKLLQEFSTVAPTQESEAVDLESIAAVTAAAVASPRAATSTSVPSIAAAGTISVTATPATPRYQSTLAQVVPSLPPSTTVFRAGATPTAVLAAPQKLAATSSSKPAAAPKQALSALSLFSNVPPEPGQSSEPSSSSLPGDLADDLLDFSSHDLAAVAQAAMGLDENGEPLPGNEESHRALADAMQRLAAPQDVDTLDLYNDNPVLAAGTSTSSEKAPGYPRDRQQSQRSEGDWENGERSGSPPSKRFQCPKCDRAFARAYNLNTHLSTHDPDPQRSKPFPCPYPACKADGGRSFSRKHDLQRHVASTHENDPEPGAHGDEGGAHATGGLQSLGLGTPGRKFRCEECGRGFVRRDALKRHNCSRIKGSGSDQGSVDLTDLDAEVGATLAAALAQASALPDAYALYSNVPPYVAQSTEDVKPKINMATTFRPRPPVVQQAPTGAVPGSAHRPAPPIAAGTTVARPGTIGGALRPMAQTPRPGAPSVAGRMAPFYPNGRPVARPAETLAPRPGQPGARPLAHHGARPPGAPVVRPPGVPGSAVAPRPRPAPGIMPPAGPAGSRPPGNVARPILISRPPLSALVRPGVRPSGAIAPRPGQLGVRPPSAVGARPFVGNGNRPVAPPGGIRPIVAGARPPPRPLAPGVARPVTSGVTGVARSAPPVSASGLGTPRHVPASGAAAPAVPVRLPVAPVRPAVAPSAASVPMPHTSTLSTTTLPIPKVEPTIVTTSAPSMPAPAPASASAPPATAPSPVKQAVQVKQESS